MTLIRLFIVISISLFALPCEFHAQSKAPKSKDRSLSEKKKKRGKRIHIRINGVKGQREKASPWASGNWSKGRTGEGSNKKKKNKESESRHRQKTRQGQIPVVD